MFAYLAMIFVAFEMLSMLFNNFFWSVYILGVLFPLNISVIFFCMGFFILDLTTELYDNKAADKLIYGKIICQLIFVVFGYIGIVGANLEHSQLARIIINTPHMILNGIIASLIGYKLTVKIMQALKVKYEGRFLMLRYLSSTLPGELLFSFIFSLLSFAPGKTFDEYLMIFLSLSLVKILLSTLFSFLVVPITKLLSHINKKGGQSVSLVPFR